MTTQTTTNAQEQPAVLSAVPATALGGQAGTGPIAIFYGAARYPFELARQRELVEDYAETTGLNLVTEFHDRQQDLKLQQPVRCYLKVKIFQIYLLMKEI